MAVSDILLQLSSYPGLMSFGTIAAAACLAKKLDARTSAGLRQIRVTDIPVPPKTLPNRVPLARLMSH